MYLRKSPRKLEIPSNSQKENWEYYNPLENSFPVQYCLDSSLHGIQYIGQQDRHCVERIFWIIAFIASVVCAGWLIHQLWETHINSPIVTQFDPIETDLWKVAFPAVTICNVNKIKYSKRREYLREAKISKAANNETCFLKSLAAIEDMRNVCDLESFAMKMVRNTSARWSHWYDEFNEDLENRKEDYQKFTDPSKILLEASQKCNEMLLFCTWQDEIRNCSELIRPIVTDYGYCCTFNMIPPTVLKRFYNYIKGDPAEVEEWAKAELTSDKLIWTPGKPYLKLPYRQQYSSRTSGLSVMLEPNLTEYFCSSTDSEGFVVGLNLPLTFPRMKDGGIFVQPGTETSIKINPQITISDESIKKFNIDHRNCYFEDERSLPHYTKYTATNCISECISKLTLDKCHCVRYYMPRRPEFKICRPDQYACATEVERNATEGENCMDCNPTCTDIQYQAEVSALRIRQHYMEKLYRAYPNKIRTNDSSIVHIYFGQATYKTMLRKEMHTIIDLISSAGGLLGLCLGFSMLSLLEIVYFCTIRICFNYRRKYIERARLAKMDLDVAPYHRKAEQISSGVPSKDLRF